MESENAGATSACRVLPRITLNDGHRRLRQVLLTKGIRQHEDVAVPGADERQFSLVSRRRFPQAVGKHLHHIPQGDQCMQRNFYMSVCLSPLWHWSELTFDVPT